MIKREMMAQALEVGPLHHLMACLCTKRYVGV